MITDSVNKNIEKIKEFYPRIIHGVEWGTPKGMSKIISFFKNIKKLLKIMR